MAHPVLFSRKKLRITISSFEIERSIADKKRKIPRSRFVMDCLLRNGTYFKENLR